MFFSSPRIELQSPARNIKVFVRFQGNRWTVFLAGPLMGPAVLFWGVVIVILVLAVSLSLLPKFPLTTVDAVILSLGATLSNVWVLLLVGIWFSVLWVREKNSQQLVNLNRTYYRVLQICTITLSLLALLALVITIPQALLGSPDMQITGNQSDSSMFHWYSDEIAQFLPEVSVISLPNWIYLILMLAWSLWLAFAIVRWSISAWQQLNGPYLWNTSHSDQVEERARNGDDKLISSPNNPDS